MTDPQPEFSPVPGSVDSVAPGLRRILAPNPSPMTFRGTNTYLLGETALAVIDPGPQDEAHLQAILDAVRPGQRITHVLVTHAHLDHSPLARRLSEATGAPVLAFGPAEAGRSPSMQALAADGRLGGGEGVDSAFVPDITLRDGEIVAQDGWRLVAHHTPGHMANHLSFAWDGRLFSGDLVMGWASSLVSPPDGDLGAFMASLRRLRSGRWSMFYPGHGAPVGQPLERLSWLLAHREGREAEILHALRDGPADADTLARRIYTATPAGLLPAAARNVLAHLVDLAERGRVTTAGALCARAEFTLL